MTEDFDFDFDVNRGRSGSRTQDREPDDAAGHGNGRDLPDPETGNGHGSRDRPALDFGFGDYEEPAPRTPSDAPEPESDQGAKRERRRPRANPEDRPGESGSGNGPRAHASRARKLLDRSQDLLYKDENGSSDPAGDEWLTFEEDLDRDLTALREHDDGPAGPPTPGEARNFAKEARRRASRRPSPILDLNEERERRRDRDRPEDADVDFESILEHQPQKSGVARRGSAVRNALRGGVESVRRVGGERIAESRGRIVALRERVPSRIPAPRPGGGDGKPPPPRLPRRIGSRRPRKPQPGRIKWLRIAIVLVGLGLLGIVSLFFGMMMAISRDLPQLENRKEFAEAQNSEVFDAAGNKIGTLLNNNRRILVESEDISPYMKSATVAIEDERFYEHGGVDLEGIARAALKDLEAGEAVEGGSTITQQLVRKLCIRNPQRTIERKIEEAKLAIEYAKRHSRREILGQYLNTASYGTVEGATAVGVQAASKIYFSRPVWKLSLTQAALLAGLPQAPTDYNPLLHPGRARQRRNAVLAQMASQGYVSPERARAARQRGLGLDASGSYFAHRMPYFFDYVEGELLDRYGVDAVRDGGLRVYTTIDPRLQEVAEAAMRSALPYSTDPSSALVSIDPRNGHVETMASSSEYGASKFNLAAQGHRQPGSTFKTFVLTAAIKQGVDPYATYYTSKPLNLDLAKWGHWEVHTADEGYLGNVNLQQATVASDNTVFAQLDLDVGPRRVAEAARSLGIVSPLDGIPAEGIGGLRIGVSPLEMASAYATLAAGGVRRDPVTVRRVVFPDGRVERPKRERPRRVVSAAVAYEVTRLLHDNITEGTGTAAYTGCPGQAGKTGTTDRETDAWFAGYQPNLASVVWVGYPQSNAIEMTSVHGITVYGGTFPADIWHALYAEGEVPCEEFRKPQHPIEWAPFFGHFTASAPRGKGGGGDGSGGYFDFGDEKGAGQAGGGYNGYDPDAYAPGAGQEPTPVPPPPPTAGVGTGGAAGETGSE